MVYYIYRDVATNNLKRALITINEVNKQLLDMVARLVQETMDRELVALYECLVRCMQLAGN